MMMDKNVFLAIVLSNWIDILVFQQPTVLSGKEHKVLSLIFNLDSLFWVAVKKTRNIRKNTITNSVVAIVVKAYYVSLGNDKVTLVIVSVDILHIVPDI